MYRSTINERTAGRNRIRALLLVALLSTAAACQRQGPTGQTVATVDGKPITASELKAELANLPPATREQAKAQVLQAMIDRRLLAAEAEKQKLDKAPTFVLQERRLHEVMLAQQALQSFARSAQQPISQTEINTYLDRHPNVGAARRLLVADQIRFATPPKPVLDALGPTRTLDQVIAVLQQRGVKIERGRGQFDTATLPQDAVAQLDKLAIGEPLISISGPTAIASAIVDQRPAPLAASEQVELARKLIAAERGQASVKQRTDSLRQAATIEYSAGYKPAPTAPPTR